MNHNQNTPPTSNSSKRHVTNEMAFLEVQGRSGKILCRMCNLSQTGAFFEVVSSHFYPKQGDMVRVTVQLKQINRSHIIHGEVIWNKGLGIGIAFIKAKELIKKVVR